MLSCTVKLICFRVPSPNLDVYFETNFSFEHNKIILNKSDKTLDFVRRNTKHLKASQLWKLCIVPYRAVGHRIWIYNLVAKCIHSYKRHWDGAIHVSKKESHTYRIHLYLDSCEGKQRSISLDKMNLRRELSNILFIYDLLNGYIDRPRLFFSIEIRVLTCFSWSNDLFVVFHYMKSSSVDSFFPRALLLANKIFTSLDLFDCNRNKLKCNVVLMLRNNVN